MERVTPDPPGSMSGCVVREKIARGHASVLALSGEVGPHCSRETPAQLGTGRKPRLGRIEKPHRGSLGARYWEVPPDGAFIPFKTSWKKTSLYLHMT